MSLPTSAPTPAPAHHTKHLKYLTYHYKPSDSTFHLQQLDDGVSNGTALWLGAQCLASFLPTLPIPHHISGTHPRVVELGSGIGLTALALSSLGWDVLATDIPHVHSSVLSPNLKNNLDQLPKSSGKIQSRTLDWTVSPDLWSWHNPLSVASIDPASLQTSHVDGLLKPPFDLICSADTVYLSALVQPLLRTFHTLATMSYAASSHMPPVYLCIERRDPGLVNSLLYDAKHFWGFTVDRVPHRRLAKAMKKSGLDWERAEWEGVEIWKLVLSR